MSHRKMKTCKDGKVESIHTGVVLAKQPLHLPVMGVNMLSFHLQGLHGHCVPTSRHSI